ncbi:hypothetical protein ABPG74_013630 [Tetrahymena malaccensis]
MENFNFSENQIQMTIGEDSFQSNINIQSYQEYQQFECQRHDVYQQKIQTKYCQSSTTSFTQQIFVLNNNNSKTTTISQVIQDEDIIPSQQNPGISLQLRNSLSNNLLGSTNNQIQYPQNEIKDQYNYDQSPLNQCNCQPQQGQDQLIQKNYPGFVKLQNYLQSISDHLNIDKETKSLTNCQKLQPSQCLDSYIVANSFKNRNSYPNKLACKVCHKYYSSRGGLFNHNKTKNLDSKAQDLQMQRTQMGRPKVK